MIDPKQFTPEQDKARIVRGALLNLIYQIDISNPVDDHGHDFKKNAAYIYAQKVTLN